MPHSNRLKEKMLNNMNNNNNSNKNNSNLNSKKKPISNHNKSNKGESNKSQGFENSIKSKNKNGKLKSQKTNIDNPDIKNLDLPPLPRWTNKQKKERDLLKMIQADYPTNPYVQRISKTCLSRRLFKKIMYQHIFNYYQNGNVDDKKVKSSGECACYKNCKTIFKFSDDKIKNIDKINELMATELKQQFTKIDDETHEYIIAGKISCPIFQLITKIFKRNLLKEFSIVNATLEFYEFYEELVNEFNDKEKNVKIMGCEEIVLKQLRQDFKNLLLCREYVRKKKADGAI